MAVKFRSVPLYIKSRKIAETSGGTYEHNSGDEAQIGTEGYIGHSDGADMASVQFDTVVPVRGHELALKSIIKNKEDVTVGAPIDGSFESFTGRMTSRSDKWDSKTGTCTGSFKIEGGKPDVT